MHFMVGSNIKQYRKKRKMTQAQLGEKLGLSQAEISRIENGKVAVTTDQLDDIATALKVIVNKLLRK